MPVKSVTKRPTRVHPWYNLSRILSLNAVFMFVTGGRGLGKTFSAKRKAIKANLKDGSEFIYLRRYDSELKTAKHTFFDDIVAAGLFPDWDFRVMGIEAQRAHVSTREDKKRVWHRVGYFASLSTAQTHKSVAYPSVTLIIFDEFISESLNARYLTDEVTVFTNFFSTVDRAQDKTQVLFLANSVSIMNPYFLEYEIRPDQLPKLGTLRDGFIAYEFPDAADFKRSIYNTRFGRFIQGTEYAKFAVENQFEDANDALVDVKPASAVYYMTLETIHGTFSVWLDNGVAFAQRKRPRGNERFFTLIPARMSEGRTLLQYGDGILTYLRRDFKRGNIFFDSPQTRNAFVEIFKR